MHRRANHGVVQNCSCGVFSRSSTRPRGCPWPGHHSVGRQLGKSVCRGASLTSQYGTRTQVPNRLLASCGLINSSTPSRSSNQMGGCGHWSSGFSILVSVADQRYSTNAQRLLNALCQFFNMRSDEEPNGMSQIRRLVSHSGPSRRVTFGHILSG